MSSSKFIKKIKKYSLRISIGAFLALFIMVAQLAPEIGSASYHNYLKILMSFIGIAMLGFIALIYKTKDPIKEIVIGFYIALIPLMASSVSI